VKESLENEGGNRAGQNRLTRRGASPRRPYSQGGGVGNGENWKNKEGGSREAQAPFFFLSGGS